MFILAISYMLTSHLICSCGDKHETVIFIILLVVPFLYILVFIIRILSIYFPISISGKDRYSPTQVLGLYIFIFVFIRVSCVIIVYNCHVYIEMKINACLILLHRKYFLYCNNLSYTHVILEQIQRQQCK